MVLIDADISMLDLYAWYKVFVVAPGSVSSETNIH